MRKYKLLQCGCGCDAYRIYFTQYGVEVLICNQCHEATSDEDVRKLGQEEMNAAKA